MAQCDFTSLKKGLFYAVFTLLATMSPMRVYAQEELNIEQIRKELREAAAKSAQLHNELPSEVSGSDFALTDKEEVALDQDLEKKEAELMKKLGNQENSSISQNQDVESTLFGKQATVSTEVVKEGPNDSNLTDKGTVDSTPQVASVASSSQPIVEPIGRESDSVPVPKRDKDTKETVLKQQIQEIATLRRSNSDISAKLKRTESQNASLRNQLADAKNRLMLAETEVERLSSVLDSRNQLAASRVSGKAPSQSAAAIRAGTQFAPSTKASAELPVITVITDKANLRTGPGMDNSPLMAVSRGTRLVVEKREGEWYRVVTPTGTRAWISSDLVAFARTSSNSSLRIKGYDSALENMASTMVPHIAE